MLGDLIFILLMFLPFLLSFFIMFILPLMILLEVTTFFLIHVSLLKFQYMLLAKQMQNIPNRYRIRKYIEILKRNNKKFFFFFVFADFPIE